MAYVIEIPNPFEPYKDVRRYEVHDQISIRGWLERTYPGFIEFEFPTICIVNGHPVLRSQWHRPIAGNDIVEFRKMPKGPFIVFAIIIIAVAVLLSFLFQPDIHTPGELPASGPLLARRPEIRGDGGGDGSGRLDRDRAGRRLYDLAAGGDGGAV